MKNLPITYVYYQIFTKFFTRFDILCLSETLSVPGQSDDVVSESEGNSQKFISTLLESLFILRKIPETAEVIAFAVTQFYVFSFSIKIIFFARLGSFFIYSLCLAFRFITFSNISVHFNMMRIYASIRNQLDAC